MAFTSESFPTVPVNRFLGFTLVRHDEKSATVRFQPRSDHRQEYGVVQGGIISSLADTAAVYAVYPFIDKTQRMTSVEFKINFLAGAMPERGDLIAEAKVVRKGRSIAVLNVDVHQGDVHVATGLFTYIIFSERS